MNSKLSRIVFILLFGCFLSQGCKPGSPENQAKEADVAKKNDASSFDPRSIAFCGEETKAGAHPQDVVDSISKTIQPRELVSSFVYSKMMGGSLNPVNYLNGELVHKICTHTEGDEKALWSSFESKKVFACSYDGSIKRLLAHKDFGEELKNEYVGNATGEEDKKHRQEKINSIESAEEDAVSVHLFIADDEQSIRRYYLKHFALHMFGVLGPQLKSAVDLEKVDEESRAATERLVNLISGGETLAKAYLESYNALSDAGLKESIAKSLEEIGVGSLDKGTEKNPVFKNFVSAQTFEAYYCNDKSRFHFENTEWLTALRKAFLSL